MHAPQTGYSKWAGIGIAIAWQTAFVGGCFVMAVWMWPAGLLETPLSELTLGPIVRAVVSVAFLSVGVTSLYLAAVEPFVRGYAELFTREDD
jgi:hypothetical protein